MLEAISTACEALECCNAARDWEVSCFSPRNRWNVEEERTPQPRNSQCRPDLAKAVASSLYILKLPQNPEDENGPVYSKETWIKAVAFLLSLASGLAEQFSVSLFPPEILPSESGSIDIHWRSNSFELLINIPSVPGQDVTYYGDNTRGNMPIENSCSASAPDRKLVAWLSLVI